MSKRCVIEIYTAEAYVFYYKSEMGQFIRIPVPANTKFEVPSEWVYQGWPHEPLKAEATNDPPK